MCVHVCHFSCFSAATSLENKLIMFFSSLFKPSNQSKLANWKKNIHQTVGIISLRLYLYACVRVCVYFGEHKVLKSKIKENIMNVVIFLLSFPPPVLWLIEAQQQFFHTQQHYQSVRAVLTVYFKMTLKKYKKTCTIETGRHKLIIYQ